MGVMLLALWPSYSTHWWTRFHAGLRRGPRLEGAVENEAHEDGPKLEDEDLLEGREGGQEERAQERVWGTREAAATLQLITA